MDIADRSIYGAVFDALSCSLVAAVCRSQRVLSDISAPYIIIRFAYSGATIFMLSSLFRDAKMYFIVVLALQTLVTLFLSLGGVGRILCLSMYVHVHLTCVVSVTHLITSRRRELP